MFVIQITGGRDYTDGSAIYNAMQPYIEQYGAKNVIVRHGKARGADSLSHFQARKLGVPADQIQARPPEFYGYSWKPEDDGNAAGNLRNLAMLDEEPKPNIVLAFPDANSTGTHNMIGFAKERGIEVIVEGEARTSIEIDVEFGLSQELSAAMLVADEVWPGSQVSRLPEYSDLDFVVTWRGNTVAFLEIKARRNKVDDYNSTIVALRKHTIAEQIYRQLKVQTLAIIVFEDALVSFHLENTPDHIDSVTRVDRGVSTTHAFYNHSRFTFHMRKESNEDTTG